MSTKSQIERLQGKRIYEKQKLVKDAGSKEDE
jgi:hypothetical protein